MNWKAYESLSQLKQELEAYLETQQKEHTAKVVNKNKDEKDRLYSIGHLDCLKFLSQQLTFNEAAPE